MHKKQFFFLAFFLLISLGKINSFAEKLSLEKEITRMISLLEKGNFYQRQIAAQRLAILGPKTIERLLANFPAYNYVVRKELVSVIAQSQHQLKISFLYQILVDSSNLVREEAASALLKISDNHNILPTLLSVQKQHPKNSILQDLIETIRVKDLEKELEKLISVDGSYSFDSEQFQGLKTIGNDAILPLTEIFFNEHPSFVHVKWNQDRRKCYCTRILAGQALGEFVSTMTPLQRPIVNYHLRKTFFGSDDVEIQILAACNLAKMGDRSYFYRKEERYKKKITENPQDPIPYFNLGMLYLRVNSLPRAIRYLEKAIERSPNNIMYYNLSCAYAYNHKADKAIAYIEKAIEHGFNDIEWLKRDGSFKHIRNNPDFQSLLNRLEKDNDLAQRANH